MGWWEVHYLGILATTPLVLFLVVFPRDHLPRKKMFSFGVSRIASPFPPFRQLVQLFFSNLAIQHIVILSFGQGPSPHLPILGHARKNTFFIREMFPEATECINSIDGSTIIFIFWYCPCLLTHQAGEFFVPFVILRSGGVLIVSCSTEYSMHYAARADIFGRRVFRGTKGVSKFSFFYDICFYNFCEKHPPYMEKLLQKCEKYVFKISHLIFWMLQAAKYLIYDYFYFLILLFFLP